jgi:hypothetical protein
LHVVLSTFPAALSILCGAFLLIFRRMFEAWRCSLHVVLSTFPVYVGALVLFHIYIYIYFFSFFSKLILFVLLVVLKLFAPYQVLA